MSSALKAHVDANISPLAGRPAPPEMLIDPARLEREYFERYRRSRLAFAAAATVIQDTIWRRPEQPNSATFHQEGMYASTI
jgi:hypothetical protein